MDNPPEHVSPGEHESPLEQKGREVRKHWFNNLPATDQDGIIKPEFDRRLSHDEKRQATQDYENDA